MGRIINLILLVMLVNGYCSAQSDFVLPMKIKPVVSGSFAEIRSNHFHSGLDLTTNGKTGYRIYASDIGYVSRIKVSSGGYGKAIYIDHPSGHTTVYAHLERYSNKIDSIVKLRQYEKKSFGIELFFKKGELTVDRGEVVGYSGNSGSSGGPHLHYEIRDKATQKPTDPMLFRSDIPDDVKPQIQGLKIYPLSKDASVKGVDKEKYYPTVHYDGQFHPKGWKELRVHGEIGIGVQVLDYLSESWRKCGVKTIELFANDSLVYASDVEEFSFAETRYLNAHIDYAEKKRTGKVIQRSYILPNNRLSIYKVKERYSIKVLPNQRYKMKYIIKDVTGNTSILEFILVGDQPYRKELKTYDNKRLKYNQHYSIDTLGMKISIPSNSLYEDAELLVHRNDSITELLSPVYTIGDDHIPMHKLMKVELPVPDSLLAWKEKLCVIGLTASNKTYYRGGKFEEGFVKMSTRNFGRIAIGIDTIPPKIRLRKAPASNNYTSRKSIEVLISDDFSGIDHFECLINGNWALFEYDGKRSLLSGAFKDIDTNKGENELVVKVIDAKGNSSEYKTKFIR